MSALEHAEEAQMYYDLLRKKFPQAKREELIQATVVYMAVLYGDPDAPEPQGIIQGKSPVSRFGHN